MKLPWKFHWHQIFISLLIGFFLGAGAGHFKHMCFGKPHRPGEMKEFMIKKLSKDLHLNEGQKTKVSAIFDLKQPQMMALHEQMRPQFEALRNSTNDEIRKVLNPDQISKFEQINAEMEKRFNEFRQPDKKK